MACMETSKKNIEKHHNYIIFSIIILLISNHVGTSLLHHHTATHQMKLTSWAAITGWRLLLVLYHSSPDKSGPENGNRVAKMRGLGFAVLSACFSDLWLEKKTCISCWCFAGCIVCTTTRRFFCDAIEGSFVGHRPLRWYRTSPSKSDAKWGVSIL